MEEEARNVSDTPRYYFSDPKYLTPHFYRLYKPSQRHGIIYPDGLPEAAPTACAYCDTKLAPMARRCDYCGGPVKEEKQ